MFRGTVVLITLVALAVAPAAVAAPGSLDASFGTGGIALGGKGMLSAGALDAQGRLVVAGVESPYSPGPIRVSRWTDAGALDLSFGDQGTATLARPGAQLAATAVVAATDGSTYVSGGGQGGAFVARLTAAGALDPGFGLGGIVELEAAKGGFVWGMASTPGGLAVAYSPYGAVSARLVRLTASGALDPAFGNAGTADTRFDPSTLPPSGASGEQMLVRRADGTLLLGGVRDGRPVIAAFTDDGGWATSFGDDGIAPVPNQYGYGVVNAITVAQDGSVLALSTWGAVVHLTADGVVDPDFGVAGRRSLNLSGLGTTTLSGLVPQPGGGVLVSGSAVVQPAPPVPAAFPPPAGSLYVSSSTVPSTSDTPADYGAFLTRLTPAGAVDCTYGDYGRTKILPAGAYAAQAQTLLLDGAGRAVTLGTSLGQDGPLQLLTRTEAGAGSPSAPAAPSVLLRGLGGYGYSRDPLLTGWVDPRCSDVAWHVEYGTTAAYGTATPDVALPGGAGPAPVAVTLPGLPADTYHYRLVASGPNGSTASGDATFTISVSTGLRGPGGTITMPGGGKAGGAKPGAAIGRLRFLSTHATLRSGKARFAVRCRDGACKKATVTLRRGRTSLGSAHVSLASGKKGYVTIKLNAAGRRAAKRHRLLTATASLAVPGAKARTAKVVVRSVRAKRTARR